MWKRAAVSLSAPPFGQPDILESPSLPHLDETSAALFEQLRDERNNMARLLGVPTYVICQDATLARIAVAKPSTRDEMLEVKGVGPASEERFGRRFRALIESRSSMA